MRKSVFAAAILSAALILCGCRSDRAPQDQIRQEPVKPAQAESASIVRVLPGRDGSAAVLYSNGRVKVAGNDPLMEAVSLWPAVEDVFYQYEFSWDGDTPQISADLIGLTGDGSVLSTSEDFSDWSGVKEVCTLPQGLIGITESGKVMVNHINPKDPIASVLGSMDGVDTLVYSSTQSVIAVLKKDGSVRMMGSDGSAIPGEAWDNVQELRDSGHSFYVIKKDGTVAGGLEDAYPSLKNAKKIISVDDLLVGISEDGRLLTHNGGNIYTNAGCMYVDVPGSDLYSGEVEISQYDQVQDIISFYGLVLLNRDGTVDSIGSPEWNVSDWRDIRRVYGAGLADGDQAALYGIHQNGTVSLVRLNGEKIDQYQNWRLEKIFPGMGGVIGLTAEGDLVGDGVYQKLDFSAF